MGADRHDSVGQYANRSDIVDERTKWILTEHAELIESLRRVYSILVELRYFRPEEVTRPPYSNDPLGDEPALAHSELRSVGFTDEVVALMGQLPYPSNSVLDRFSTRGEGVPMAPDSQVVSYLAGQKRSLIRSARSAEGEVSIPAWAFKITTCGEHSGNSYIYDTREKIIYRWAAHSQFSEYVDQPNRPVREAFDIMCGEIESLDWLPWRVEVPGVERMDIYNRPSMKQHMSSLGTNNRYSVIENDENESERAPTREGFPKRNSLPKSEDQRVAHKLEVARAVTNIYQYKRRLYQECGWPHAFRGDEFERRRQELEKEHYEMMERLGPGGLQIQNMEQGESLRQWYEEKAGEKAV